jgi:hypothetical protein
MPWDLASDRRAMAGFVILTNPVHERHGMPKANQSLGREAAPFDVRGRASLFRFCGCVAARTGGWG